MDPALREKVIDQALAELELEWARYFPRGAVLDVKVNDGALSVSTGGTDVSGLARQIVRVATTTLKGIGESVPAELTPRDVIALMGLELHHDPAAFSLKD